MRRRRHYDATGVRQRESLMEAADLLRAEGADLAAALRSLHVELVLTAHPTEATRRSVLDHQLHVAKLLDGLDDPRIGRSRRRALLLRAARGADDLVADRRGAPRAPDGRGRGPPQPVLLRGDAVRRGARGARGARALLRGPRRRPRAGVRLVGRLGHGRPPGGRRRDARAHALAAPRDRAAAAAREGRRGSRGTSRTPRAACRSPPRWRRRWSATRRSCRRRACCAAPTASTSRCAPSSASSPGGCSNMLDPLAREPGYATPRSCATTSGSCCRASARRTSRTRSLRRLLWQIDVFGFHVASLDVRQSASVVHEAVATLLPGYRDAGEEERMRLLEEAIAEQRRGLGRRPDGPGGRAAARARHGRARARGLRQARGAGDGALDGAVAVRRARRALAHAPRRRAAAARAAVRDARRPRARRRRRWRRSTTRRSTATRCAPTATGS